MTNLNDDDLLIVYRPSDQSNYKLTYKQLKEAILEEIDGGNANSFPDP